MGILIIGEQSLEDNIYSLSSPELQHCLPIDVAIAGLGAKLVGTLILDHPAVDAPVKAAGGGGA